MAKQERPSKQLLERLEAYHFELKHVMVLFIILIFFQVLVSFVHKVSLQNFLFETQKLYQEDFAERVGNLTATSLELLLETAVSPKEHNEEEIRKMVQAFNIILTQQHLQQQIEDICIIIADKGKTYAVDDGQTLYAFLAEQHREELTPDSSQAKALRLYEQLKDKIMASGQIQVIFEEQQTFHVFVPFVPKGEYAGVVYMRNHPDFGLLSREIISSYNEASLIFTALILFGLLAMFYISSYTVQERDATQELLYREKETQLKERINYQKEAQFTKRIYHTHHKAEKVMGFIKEDVRALSELNIEHVKYRVTKYANFISRVIYDMKWYEPPIQAIRNPLFRTDLNEVIHFIVEHIILRVAKDSKLFKFELELDENLPPVHINEFVVWEVIEPILQNAIDHNSDTGAEITIKTTYSDSLKMSKIFISDTGKGIDPELLERDENGRRNIFQENISTKEHSENSGYGCYLAYEIAKQRCNWDLDVRNLHPHGCQFTFTIQN